MVSTKGLRVGLVVAAVLVLGVVLGFIGYAHWRAQKFLLGLPGRLGIDIRQESDGVTYSQSFEGRTIYTVHAAKQIQRSDGTYTLRDVGIVLYGKDGTRADKIHGQEFLYDQKAGMLTAVGEAFLDLGAKNDDPRRVVHVKTSGMVYRAKEKTAVTAEPIEFMAGGLSGQAVGASYDGGTGVVVLEHAVKVSGVKNDKPMVMTAGRAELDKAANIVKLEGVRYTAEGDSGAQKMVADRAVVRLNGQGVAERVEAEGHVGLSGENRGIVTSERMEADLNAKGGVKDGHLWGGVSYWNDSAVRQERGRAEDARVNFDGAGRPVRAVMVGGVVLDVVEGAVSRRLLSRSLDVSLGTGGGGGGKGKTLLRGGVAEGGAVLRLVDQTGSTEVRGEKLTGRFSGAGVVEGLDGAGGTAVERVSAKYRDLSEGAVLRMDFAPGKGGKMELARAMQKGNVVTVREAGKTLERGKGDEADYDAGTDVMVMRGGVQVSDEGRVLLADRVTADRGTGVGVAEGSVRVSYVQEKGEPVHVTAGKAVGNKATGVTEFTAAAGGKVRLWEGGEAVEAPVIDFDRTGKKVVAKGGARAVLAGGVRVFGSEMTYTDAARTVELGGPVRVVDAGGTVEAESGVVYLGPGGLGGSVERVVAQGGVVVDQPGREAKGEKLVYTAGDETYLLTGSPRLVDAVQGTVAGSSIRFRRGEDTVVVSGEGGRVRSEPRVREKQ